MNGDDRLVSNLLSQCPGVDQRTHCYNRQKKCNLTHAIMHCWCARLLSGVGSTSFLGIDPTGSSFFEYDKI